MINDKAISADLICRELGIDPVEVVNIYPYGSHIYGTNRIDSDHDYIIVFRSALLKSRNFKDNAISNGDHTIQGSSYSRSGFQDAINNYNISALESISLPERLVLKKEREFKLGKYHEKSMAKSVITQASSSWHIAKRRWFMENKAGDVEAAMPGIKKGIWHALRILMFGNQFKADQRITDFYAANGYLKDILNDGTFDPDKYKKLRNYYIKELRR